MKKTANVYLFFLLMIFVSYFVVDVLLGGTYGPVSMAINGFLSCRLGTTLHLDQEQRLSCVDANGHVVNDFFNGEYYRYPKLQNTMECLNVTILVVEIPVFVAVRKFFNKVKTNKKASEPQSVHTKDDPP